MTTMTFPELKETEGQLAERRAKLKGIFDEATTAAGIDLMQVKSLDGDTAARVEAIRAINDEIDDLAVKAEGLRAVAKAAANAAARDDVETAGPSGDAPAERKSFAQRLIESKALTQKGVEHNLDIELKTLMETGAGWAPWSERRDTVIDKATRPVELVDLIPQTTTGATGSINYFEETTFTNAAAETAEGGTYPEAALALTERTATIVKIPVFLPLTDEQLEDEPRVQGYVDNRLPFMVRQRLALQIAAGDGSSPNLRGVLNVVGIQTQAKSSDPTPDAVYKAMVKVMTTGQAQPDAYVTNPLDWQDVRLLRTTDGIYIWGSPSEAGPERIWGLRVVQAQAMTQNTGVVGDFANFSELAVRKQVTVQLGLNGDDFKSGRQTLRAEMRAALIWYRPAAFCTVTGI